MAKLTLRQAAAWCGGRVEEKYADVEFFGANNDTRVLQPGQLFIVLQGARDGHDFIPAAMEKGAAAVLCSRKVGDYPAIYVEDPRIALGKIAREELRRIDAKVVGITGSVGKSTTKEMVACVLESTYVTAKTPANHNNDIGMPMAILSMDMDTQVAVLEMGMNHFGEIEYLSNIAHPDVAVIINIGTTHIEFLGSQEGIRRAKMEIVEGMTDKGLLLLNGDDTLLRYLNREPKQRITYFGRSEGCAIRGLDVRQDGEVLRFRLEAGKLSGDVAMLLEGEHYVADALAAVSVGLKLGVPFARILESLSRFRNLAGRQEIFEKNGFVPSDAEGDRSLGYDYGLFLYAMSVQGNDLCIPALETLLNILDETGAWVEYYHNGKPYNCRCRPWESAINIDAIHKLAERDGKVK